MDENQDSSASKPLREKIIDRCPSCGGQSLFVGGGGYLTCGNLSTCKEPGVGRAIELLQRNDRVAQVAIDGLKASLADTRERLREMGVRAKFERETAAGALAAARVLYVDLQRAWNRHEAGGAAVAQRPMTDGEKREQDRAG